MGNEACEVTMGKVTLAMLDDSAGAALDARVEAIGLKRLRGEADFPLRNRAFAYAEEWGLLVESDAFDGDCEGV